VHAPNGASSSYAVFHSTIVSSYRGGVFPPPTPPVSAPFRPPSPSVFSLLSSFSSPLASHVPIPVLHLSTVGPRVQSQVDPSGRTPSFHWSVVPLNDAALASPVGQAAPSGPALAAPVLTLGPGDLAPDAAYRFTLAVGTFLGASATSSVDVSVASAPLPSVSAPPPLHCLTPWAQLAAPCTCTQTL
jgi:hypothetical protein